jgi:hypothetical protein
VADLTLTSASSAPIIVGIRPRVSPLQDRGRSKRGARNKIDRGERHLLPRHPGNLHPFTYRITRLHTEIVRFTRLRVLAENLLLLGMAARRLDTIPIITGVLIPTAGISMLIVA